MVVVAAEANRGQGSKNDSRHVMGRLATTDRPTLGTDVAAPTRQRTIARATAVLHLVTAVAGCHGPTS